MDTYRTVSISRTYVPNEYIVFLAREDRRQFEGYEQALLDELSQHLLDHAARENLSLLTRPKVSFETDRRLRMGEFGIQPRLVKPPAADHEPASQGDLGATRVDSAARARQAQPEPPPHEPVTRAHGIAFAAIWTAVALYMSGMIAQRRVKS